MKHPHAGGRYYREQDGTLTRAGDDGEKPKANAAVAAKPASEPDTGGKPHKRDNMKDKGNA